jgi:hypothetical protein
LQFSIPRNARLEKQHFCIKFCFKLGAKVLQELLNLESSFWLGSGMNTSFEWFSRFKSGVSHEDDGAACSQHSSTRKGDENVN